MLTHGSLFSGIGGFDIAAEWMGWQNAFHCEINEFCTTRTLYRHYKNRFFQMERVYRCTQRRLSVPTVQRCRTEKRSR